MVSLLALIHVSVDRPIQFGVHFQHQRNVWWWFQDRMTSPISINRSTQFCLTWHDKTLFGAASAMSTNTNTIFTCSGVIAVLGAIDRLSIPFLSYSGFKKSIARRVCKALRHARSWFSRQRLGQTSRNQTGVESIHNVDDREVRECWDGKIPSATPGRR